MRRFDVVAASVLLTVVSVLPVTGWTQDTDSPILEARDISGGCCQPNYDSTYLRVFSDGKVEWDEFDSATRSYVPHKAVLSKKQMKAVQWAILNMKGLASFYTGAYAKGNIDSQYSFAITGRKNGNIYHIDIFFGLDVDADNYSDLPARVRSVACNVAVTRSQLTNEKVDLDFCRKYYVGW